MRIGLWFPSTTLHCTIVFVGLFINFSLVLLTLFWVITLKYVASKLYSTTMQTKALTLIIIFTVLTIVLTPEISRIAFPAPYAPFLIYQIWEIPIVAAFLLLSIRSAVAIAGLNSIVLLVFFQGASPLGPFYNLAAILSMLLGIYLAHRLLFKRISNKDTLNTQWKYNTTLAVAYTGLGITFRVIIMGIVNFITLGFPPPVGYALPQPIIISYYVPITAIFNATLALYTIPLGYFIAVIIKRNLRHANML
jgi:hypothetical protein